MSTVRGQLATATATETMLEAAGPLGAAGPLEAAGPLDPATATGTMEATAGPVLAGTAAARRRSGRPGRSQNADAGRGRRFRGGRRAAQLAVAAGLLAGAAAPSALAARTAAPSAAATRIEAAAAAPATKLAVPTYFTNAGDWSTLLSSSGTVGLVMVNPASGPGTSVDPTYTAIVNRIRSAGVRPLAYVATNYGTRPLAAVLADIARYRSFYGLTSVFFDEAPNVCSEKVGTTTVDHIAYYQQLFDAVHAQPDAIAVLNPGTNVPQCYLGVSDVLVTFESSASAYADWTPDPWTATVPAEHFWHLIHSVPASDRAAVVATATSRRAGYVYATPDGMPNPWGGLGGTSSFQSMVSALAQTRTEAPSSDSGAAGRSVVGGSQPTTAAVVAAPAAIAPPSEATVTIPPAPVDPMAGRRPVLSTGAPAAATGTR